MGWLEEYEKAAGVEAPAAPAASAKPKDWLEEYDEARPVSLAEGAQQVGAKFGRGLANTAAGVVQSAGLALEGMGKGFEDIPEPFRPLQGLDLVGGGEDVQAYAAAVRDYAAKALPEVERLRDSFLLSSTPEALGSATGFLLPGSWLKAAGVPAWASTMGLGAAVQSASQFEDARMHGASEEDQWHAWALGAGIGLTEAVPLARMLSRADKASGGTLKEALVHGVIEGGEEFIQESGTKLASNAIASHMLAYDEDRKLGEGVLADGSAGGAAGLILSALASASAHSLNRKGRGSVGADQGAGGEARPETDPGATVPAVSGGAGAPSEGAVLQGLQERVPEGVQPERAPAAGARPGMEGGAEPAPELRGEGAGGAPPEESVRGLRGDEGGGAPPAGERGSVGEGVPSGDARPVDLQEDAAGEPLPVPGASAGDAREAGKSPPTYAHGDEPASNFALPISERNELGPVEVLPIAGIRLTQHKNFREGTTKERVDALIDEMGKGTPLPPVTATRAPSGELVLVDGHHRVEAALAMGFAHVPVRILGPKAAKAETTTPAREPAPAPGETKTTAAETPRSREDDVAESLRAVVEQYEPWRKESEETLHEDLETFTRARAVLDERKARGLDTELDKTLGALLDASREVHIDSGSPEEQESTSRTLGLIRKAKTLLALRDVAAGSTPPVEPERRTEQPGPRSERGPSSPPETAASAASKKPAKPVPATPPSAAQAKGRAAPVEKKGPKASKAQSQEPAPTQQKAREEAWAELARPSSLVLGGPADIVLANGKTLPAHYAIIDAHDLIPSHDARRGFARNLAGDLNERDYADPVEGKPFRETVEKIAKDPNRRILLSDTPTPTDGPPIITSKGVVLGGNARGMGIQLSYERGIAQQLDFGGAVRQAAIQKGVPVDSLPREKGHPVLVRVIADGQEGQPGELSRILNESLTTAKGATTEAVSRGALVTPAAATEIAGALAGGTLRDALGDPSRAKTILRALVTSGAFSQGDLVELTDPTKGTPTQAGKQVIEDALLGAVITDVRTLSETPPAVRQTLLKALPALVRIKAHHREIAGTVTRAAQGMATLKESGQPLADALGQQTLPGVDVGWKSDRLAVAIMRSMLEETPSQVAAHFNEAADRIDDYAGGQASLFGDEQLPPALRLAREFGVTDAEKTGLVEEDEDIEDEPGEGSVVADPGELPVEMQAGYPADPVLGGGANLGTPIGGRLFGALKPPAKGKGGKVSQPEIIEALSKVVEASGGKSPIRWGRLGTRNARGVFKVQPEVIRVKVANNVSTAAHEVGHALEKHILGWVKKGPWRKPLVTREQQKELVALGKALYGNTKPEGGYKREGFAEFVRLYTMEPPAAASSAPKFHAWFESEFLKDRPEVKKALERVRDLAETWRMQGSVARAEASIVEPTSTKAKLAALRARVNADAALEALVEAGRPLNELAREAERRLGRLLAPKEDPFHLYQALRSTHSARTKQMVESGMIDLAGQRVGPALDEIRALVRGKYGDFTLYLWGKRSLALLADPKGPRLPGLSPQDAEELVREFDSPEFQRAASMVYAWSDGVLNYAAQASPDFAAVVEKIRERDPGFYIPLQREFDELDSIWGDAKKGRGLGGAGGVTKKLKGSGRRIKNPFPVLLANAERTVLAAHRRMVFDSIFRLSRIEGLGHMVEEVPVDQVPAASRTVAQLLEEVNRRVMRAAGMMGNAKPVGLGEGYEEFADAFQDVAAETITFFSPAQFPKGQDPVVPRWVNGQVKWYAVNHKVAAILAGMDVYRLPKVADLLLGVPARTMRLGTTGIRASFGLVTNPLRDFQVLYQNTRSSAWAPRLFFEWLRQVGAAGLHHASGGKWTSPYLQAFLDLGAEMAQPLGQDMDHTARAARRLFQGRAVRVVDPRNALDFVRQVLQFPETAARVTELKLLAKEIGWTPGQPITLDQSLELLLAAKQVTVDFTAAGWLGRVINQMVPFHNAPIQGTRAFARAAKRRPGAWLFRGLQFTWLSLALWWMNKDEEWYRELSARARALYWAFPFTWEGREELALIPKAHEPGLIFGSFPEALADAWYRQEPKTAREFFGMLFDTMVPNVWPVLAEEGVEQLQNEDRFWETPIVPQGELRRPPEEQAGEYTSEVAKFLGEMFNVSPRRIDHAIRGVFGGVASDVIDTVGLGGTAQSSGGELADVPVLGKLFQRGGRLGFRPRSIDELYGEIEKADQHQASIKAEETPAERQRRLMLEDAGQAVSSLSYVRSQTGDTDQRRELTRKMVEIATRALQDAKEGRAPRGPMQQERKRAQQLEEATKR